MLGGSFRLVTLNLLHHAGSWPRRAPLVERQLAALAPDVVALQEVGVPDVQTGMLAAALAGATEDRRETAACELYRRDGWSEGLAVLSSFPIEASESLEVDGEGRISLWARLRVPDGRALDLYNVHLSPHRPGRQRRQIVAVLDRMALRSDADGRVLCGDFNATPGSETIAAVISAGFASAHALRHGHDPAWTFPTALRPEVYERRGYACLDYIFVDPEQLAVRDCRVTLARPATDDPALFPSDHAGLVADLAWR